MTSYLKALTMEFPADPGLRESAVHHLEPDELVAPSAGAAAMAGVPMAGTGWMPGRRDHHGPGPAERTVHDL